MRMDTLHMTIAFLGNQTADRVERLFELGDRIRFAPFELRIDRLGCWKHNRIAWAGVAVPPPELVRLAAALRETLAEDRFPIDRRAFTPHVTLLRKIVQGPEETNLQPISWIVREFALVDSRTQPEGARYRVLGRWPAKA